jgi:protein-disulfide isomerase
VDAPIEQEPVAQPAPVAAAHAEPVAMIPRSTLNYFFTAVLCFAFGLVVGIVLMDTQSQRIRDENRTLINQAVSETVRALGAQPQAAVDPLADSTRRFTVDTAGNPGLGSEGAPVTVIEFGDFTCGFCKRFNDTTLDALLQQYEGRIRWVYRDMPILGQASRDAANAAECADDQGRFWEYHDLLFGDQASFSREGFIAKATQLGMDVEAFTACYDSRIHDTEIEQDLIAGQNLGVGGTPTFFINGRPVVGAQRIEVFQRIIEEELAAAG